MKVMFECCKCKGTFKFESVVQAENRSGVTTFMCLECVAKLGEPPSVGML